MTNNSFGRCAETSTSNVLNKCTCGHNYATKMKQCSEDLSLQIEESHPLLQPHSLMSSQEQEEIRNSSSTIGTSFPLDTSFVQIPMMHNRIPFNDNHHANQIPQRTNGKVINPKSAANEVNLISESPCANSSNDVNYIDHVTTLYHAMTTTSTTTDSVPSLCRPCLQRIEATLKADTERLLAESLMYEQAIRDDVIYRKGWKQMIHRATTTTAFDSGSEVESSNIEETYLREIHSLEQACREQREELKHLRGIQKEQVIAYEDIEQFIESLAAEQNALELEAKAFDNDQEQLSRMLSEINDEIDRLTSTDIRLTALLVQLHIDVERGLRYPLINELRLAYRPKGDLHQIEIQSAWALAAHLLLVVTSIFQFQSHNWKIVPLSHCAKLIFCPPTTATDDTSITKERKNRIVVFNLGHPKTNSSKAILAWNALLCQVTEHVKHKTSDAIQDGILDIVDIPQIPYEISPNSIGGVLLTQLNESDDSGWSRVIHYMASNLQWLSKCASLFILHQVVLLSPLQAVEAKDLSV